MLLTLLNVLCPTTHPFSLPFPCSRADLSRAPGLKCRAGRVVEFKHTSGKLVSAVLEIGERSTDAGNVSCKLLLLLLPSFCCMASILHALFWKLRLQHAPPGNSS